MYLVVTITTIAMVLVQKDHQGSEHPIYYLSHNLKDTKIKYTHVEKLALEVVQIVQIFRHYIMLQKTMAVSDCNPMTCIRSRHFLAGEIL